MLGVLAALTMVCSPAPADEPLVWAADADGGAPYVFRDPKQPDEVIGFEIDLAEALARELKRPLTFKQYDYVSLMQGLTRRDFDMAMNGLEVTPQRQAQFRLSRPYYIYKLQLVARKGDDRFEMLDDCKKAGAVVGTLGETAAERLLIDKGINVKRYEDQVGPYFDLAAGRIDAVLLDLPIASYYAKPNPKLQFVGKPFAEGTYAIAFRKDQEELAQQVDAALLKLARRGKLERIYKGWEIWDKDQLRLAQDDPSLPLTGGEDATTDAPAPGAGGSYTFSKYMPLLLRAAWATVWISVASMAVAVVLGLLIATLRMYAPAPMKWLAVTYIEFFRGVPTLLVLLFLYYGPISEWLALPGVVVAIAGLGMSYAAYEAEIYRAGIGSVPHGQWEAAASLGMPPRTTFRRIIMPQAVRTILPPMTNDFVSLFKDTSLVSVIAVQELTFEYRVMTKSTLQYVELGIATAILYLFMSLPLGYLSAFLEKKWSKGVGKN